MEKSFLTDLGIADDAAQKILDQAASELSGSDQIKTELEATKQQLADANKQIDDFKAMDMDAVKAAADDYKAKFEASEADKAAMQHQHKLEGYVKSLGLRDDVYESHVTKQLQDAGLKFDDTGKLIGGDDVVSQFKASHPAAFVDGPNTPHVIASTTHHAGEMDGVEAAFYARNPDLAPTNKEV